jgi:hypothetical protein
MMNNPYDVHSWSKQYREEALREARKQHLARRGVSRSTLLSLMLVMMLLAMILLGASGCTDSASSSVDADTDDSSASASASPSDSSTSATATPTPSSTASASVSASASASASSSASASHSATVSATAGPTATAESGGLEGDYLGLRYTAGLSPSTSMECYTFYSNGTVELRHNGAAAPTDSGSYRGDASGGEIVWNSGRTSYVVGGGGSLHINDLQVEPVESCLQ